MSVGNVLGLVGTAANVLAAGVRRVLPYAQVKETRESEKLLRTSEVARARFGQESVKSVVDISIGILKSLFPFGSLSELARDHAVNRVQAGVFRLMNWTTDKVERLLPDIREGAIKLDNGYKDDAGLCARRALGSDIARKFENFTRVCAGVAETVKVQQKMTMDSGKRFIEAFSAGLAEHEEMEFFADDERFYTAFKDHIYEALQRELSEMLPSEIEGVLDFVLPHDAIKAKIRELLILVEKTVTAPSYLKSSLADLLDICSESMEAYFRVYMEQLESPASEDVPVDLEPAYGKALMGFLRIIDPKLLNINLMKFMEWFLGREKMLTGDDRLTKLLAELTQISIEETMESNVNTWIAGIIQLVRAKLYDAHNNYIQRPLYISAQEWEQLKSIPENRPQLQDENSPLMKQLTSRYNGDVNKRFQGSCTRMMQAVSVATLVFEQHLLTPRQVVKTEVSKNKYKRWIVVASAKFLALPLVKIIIELFHRMVIWARVGMAKAIGWGAGISLAHRAGLFFESRAPSLLYRQLLVHGLQRLEILRSDIRQEPRTSIEAKAAVRAPLIEMEQS